MKSFKEFVEDVIKFPSEKRGLKYDEITGRHYRTDGDHKIPEFHVVSTSGTRKLGHSIHTSEKEATLAMKKLKLKGVKNLSVVDMS